MINKICHIGRFIEYHRSHYDRIDVDEKTISKAFSFLFLHYVHRHRWSLILCVCSIIIIDCVQIVSVSRSSLMNR